MRLPTGFSGRWCRKRKERQTRRSSRKYYKNNWILENRNLFTVTINLQDYFLEKTGIKISFSHLNSFINRFHCLFKQIWSSFNPYGLYKYSIAFQQYIYYIWSAKDIHHIDGTRNPFTLIYISIYFHISWSSYKYCKAKN